MNLGRDMYVTETKVKVRYIETDQMGVVHHSNYYAWFELGRGEFIATAGMTYGYMEKKGVMLPVLESSCKHLLGAKYEDELIIQTYIKELNGVKIAFEFNVIRQIDNKVLATGSTKHAFVNKEFKITNIKKAYPEIWDKLASLYNSEDKN